MTTQLINPNPPALVEARKNNPDWKEAQSIATALRVGQMMLTVENAKERLAAMKPEHRDAVVALVQRWVDLDRDATALVDRINAELLQEMKA